MTDPANVSPTASGGGPLPHPRSRAWPVVLLGVVILICGNIIGAGAAVLWLKQYMPPPPPPPGVAAPEIARDMQTRYNLGEEQARKVEEIMRKSIDAMEAIHREAREKAEAERQVLRTEMRAVLTPEQYAQWAAHFDQVGARRAPPQGGPGGPGAGQGPGGPGRPGGGRQGPGANPPYPQPGKGPPGGPPGMGGGQGQGMGRPPLPGAGRGPGQEGGPMRPLPPEGRRGPPAALPPDGTGPGNPPPPIAPPGGPEAAKPSEPPQR